MTFFSQTFSQGGKYEIFEEHGSAHLEIYEADVSDSGVYTCTAKNSAGSVTTNCTVTVQGIVMLSLALKIHYDFSKYNFV